MSRTHLAALAIATALAGAIAGIGMLASFHTVSTQMRPSFRGWAWTAPVTLDASIGSFSILELVLLRMALPHLLARLAVYAATAATVYLNTRGTAAGDHAQLIAHAAMPCVWALYIELLRSAAAAFTRRERRHPEHPVLALLLAPRPVLAAWRRGILASAAPSRPHQPKMSAARGHFRLPPDLRDHGAVRDRADIFPATLPGLTGPASTVPITPATGDLPDRIGKGRGLTSRHAVLDLARRNPELTSAQIAERLNLTPRTVRRHLGRR
ncbi:DUF2637 domain-containing protein [Actinospica robiniae]|uniref:DUF2637 domain-containing protein n=1 Tax=Actinospica robiniae TaxID=304901 RepID=UPI00146FC510|nr:DUF2637 domain-containing protein [Actinospica robiniae]